MGLHHKDLVDHGYLYVSYMKSTSVERYAVLSQKNLLFPLMKFKILQGVDISD